MSYFLNWQKFSVENATLDFYKFSENGVNFIGFDSTKSVPPEPMINALTALNLVKDSSVKVVMINHKFPAGLIPKVEPFFDIDTQNLDDGAVKLTFSLKPNANLSNFNANDTCHG